MANGIVKTLGGDRLGSGKKMKVELHGYERSTHDLSFLWRSTMSAGTLVPFLHELALPGDSFDIDLNCVVMTHPTVGPLFGSYKVQLDVFQAPIRLYNALLHNNALGIGMKMSQVKFPTISLLAQAMTPGALPKDIDNCQINPSALPAYLGIRGIGVTIDGDRYRDFNAIPILAYHEIYKNYYANKQEQIGAILHTPSVDAAQTITSMTMAPDSGGAPSTITQGTADYLPVTKPTTITINFTGALPTPDYIMIETLSGEIPLPQLCPNLDNSTTTWLCPIDSSFIPNLTITGWNYRNSTDINTGKPRVTTFYLSKIDDMRNAILAKHDTTAPFNLNTDGNWEPYNWLWQINNEIPNLLSSQEGLLLKTYQSDLLNNWIDTEYIDGTGGISEVTAIDTTSRNFKIDTLVLSKKVYDMLNRIAVSGGSYDDWLDAVYAHDRYTRCESPMYMGGLIKELTFQEVVSNAATTEQPLGTLAGRGVMSNKHKGGKIIIKVDEPSYIIGIVSLTPRLDYSQGNSWDVHLQTMDDLHKPALDEIGFQELITEQMAWWDTTYSGTPAKPWKTLSAGKQPAWINYMTKVNEVHGNFAIARNEMFMTLNRRFEQDKDTGLIKDLTTYIDPSKYNNIFAETSLDSQNFWTQIAVNMTARRKMSAKVMPNL